MAELDNSSQQHGPPGPERHAGPENPERETALCLDGLKNPNLDRATLETLRRAELEPDKVCAAVQDLATGGSGNDDQLRTNQRVAMSAYRNTRDLCEDEGVCVDTGVDLDKLRGRGEGSYLSQHWKGQAQNAWNSLINEDKVDNKEFKALGGEILRSLNKGVPWSDIEAGTGLSIAGAEAASQPDRTNIAEVMDVITRGTSVSQGEWQKNAAAMASYLKQEGGSALEDHGIKGRGDIKDTWKKARAVSKAGVGVNMLSSGKSLSPEEASFALHAVREGIEAGGRLEDIYAVAKAQSK